MDSRTLAGGSAIFGGNHFDIAAKQALDLAPDHQKAQNYLGLALAQKGELARAREWFLKSGNEAMAERMRQALAHSPIRDVAHEADAALAGDKPFSSAVEEEKPRKKK